MDVTFTPVETPEQQLELAKLADEIWHEYWPALIGTDQTDYMVDNFQSIEAIKRDMAENGYEYWFLEAADGNGEKRVVGYTGGAFYENLCRERGFRAMYLTVNKGNELGIRAYRGKGFETIEAVETDIGSGYIMDDYIMEKPVAL
mgnify:CR=1 FL=1